MITALSPRIKIGLYAAEIFLPLLVSFISMFGGWKIALLDYAAMLFAFFLGWAIVGEKRPSWVKKPVININKIRGDTKEFLIAGKVSAAKVLKNGTVFYDRWWDSPIHIFSFPLRISGSASNLSGEALKFHISDGTDKVTVDTKPWWTDIFVSENAVRTRLAGFGHSEAGIRVGDRVLLYRKVNNSKRLFDFRWGESVISLIGKDELEGILNHKYRYDHIIGWLLLGFAYLFSLAYYRSSAFLFLVYLLGAYSFVRGSRIIEKRLEKARLYGDIIFWIVLTGAFMVLHFLYPGLQPLFFLLTGIMLIYGFVKGVVWFAALMMRKSNQ